MFFFFQAEDGIRDYKVTGVQTCALPIWAGRRGRRVSGGRSGGEGAVTGCGMGDGWGRIPHLASRIPRPAKRPDSATDRKSTRLNSSHLVISYAVFCLKKKKRVTTSHQCPPRK